MFGRKFHKSASAKANIHILMKKFHRTGSVMDEIHSGRPRTSPEIVQRVKDGSEWSPRSSKLRLNREIGISQSTVWRFLHFTLKKCPYHIQVMHTSSKTMCRDLLQTVEHENSIDNILFNDEATFHVCGMVNCHNSRI